MVTGAQNSATHGAAWELAGARVVIAETLESALEAMAAAGIDSLLVEGGGRLAGALLGANLVDRIYQVQSPLWLGGGVPAWSGLDDVTIDHAPRWRVVARQPLGDDTLIEMER
jgi:diaminohydroxyphosphoribosylaminopyrimidine deaminase/5-amino-6-(5-phosphoribosylamino)uracil reductase